MINPQSQWQTTASSRQREQCGVSRSQQAYRLLVENAGAQALVSWSLTAATEGTISMVAEEDSDDLRCVV